MNEILQDIEDLEATVETLKAVNNPKAFMAIRSIDTIIDRKKAQVEEFEATYEQD